MWHEVWPGVSQYTPATWYLIGFPLLWLTVTGAASVASVAGLGPLAERRGVALLPSAWQFLKAEAIASIVAFLFAALACLATFVAWVFVMSGGVVLGLIQPGGGLLHPILVGLLVLIHVAAQGAALVFVWRGDF